MSKIILTVVFSALLIYAGAQNKVTINSQPNKMNSVSKTFHLSQREYEEKVHAIWAGQIIATLLGFPAEHNVASVKWIDKFPVKRESAPVDDDWYYEMIAIKEFEKYGTDMTVAQLGEQWKTYNCGSWGSSAQARKALLKGVEAPLTGHPLYNRYWFTIGPQFSADVYAALAPGMPNLAGKIARQYGHLNVYAEAVDGAVFVAGIISLGFIEKDPKTIVRKAAGLIDKQSPYRQCIDMVIELADKGKTANEVLRAVEDKWHIEYPNTNNAVANGGIVAACLWFWETDFLNTVNLACRSLDFTDSDCNAANAISAICAMKGMSAIPKNLFDLWPTGLKVTVYVKLNSTCQLMKASLSWQQEQQKWVKRLCKKMVLHLKQIHSLFLFKQSLPR
ncbi:MAG: ADP-ribosylglycohydrolase family protein [Segetibacter sp.]